MPKSKGPLLTSTTKRSTTYSPAVEHGITPLDLDLAIGWPDGMEFVLSPKDQAAPTLATARDRGLLPSWERCQASHAVTVGG